MKLRLHAGSLRLRLSQSDVARLNDEGSVQDAVTFAPGKELIYSLAAADVADMTVNFDGAKIHVTLPRSVANKWAGTEQVGIEASTETLKVLIEKDFQCLHREPEAGEDSFPNPLAE